MFAGFPFFHHEKKGIAMNLNLCTVGRFVVVAALTLGITASGAVGLVIGTENGPTLVTL